MKGMFHLAAVPLVVILAACAGAPPTTAPPTATPSPTTSPTAAPTASPTPAPPTAKPTPTASPAVQGIAVYIGGRAGLNAIELFYNPPAITVPAGAVTFLFTNQTVAAHNMVIGLQRPACTDTGCAFGPAITTSPVIGIGADAQPFEVEDLAAGSYSFWCSIQDHALRGMIGTLTVTP